MSGKSLLVLGASSEVGIKLIKAVEKFLMLSWDDKKRMGIEARRKVEREFDRQIVVDRYVDEVKRA